MSKANAQTKRVFISYSHDSQDHKDWVRGLGEYLTHNGIEVLLDQWDVAFGDDLAAFMEKGIRKTDRVIMVCTDAYIGKANNGTGGVGYEKTIATAEILRDVRLITPDMDRATITAELLHLQSAALLHGYRGAPALDVAALVTLIERVSALLQAQPRIAELDLNPVILHPAGEGVVALDALILLTDAPDAD